MCMIHFNTVQVVFQICIFLDSNFSPFNCLYICWRNHRTLIRHTLPCTKFLPNIVWVLSKKGQFGGLATDGRDPNVLDSSHPGLAQLQCSAVPWPSKGQSFPCQSSVESPGHWVFRVATAGPALKNNMGDAFTKLSCAADSSLVSSGVREEETSLRNNPPSRTRSS